MGAEVTGSIAENVRLESLTCGRISRQDLARHAAAHVGQAEVAAAVAVGQPLVIEAHQVQDRGVQVVDVHAVLDGAACRTRRSRRGRGRP